VNRLCRAVQEGDAETFVAMMKQGNEYLRVRQAARDEASR
jgi:hypothetical protein